MGVTATAALAFLDEQLNDRRHGVYLDDSERELLDAVLADNHRVIVASMNSEERARVEYDMALRNSPGRGSIRQRHRGSGWIEDPRNRRAPSPYSSNSLPTFRSGFSLPNAWPAYGRFSARLTFVGRC